MYVLLAIPSAILVVAVILELITISVYGWYADKEIIERLLTKQWEAYTGRMSSDCGMFYGSVGSPFVAKLPTPITAVWYIDELGRIPRWSKWTKKLNKAASDMKAHRRQEFLKGLDL